MGILSYFGGEAYTLYIIIYSSYFEDIYDPELNVTLDYEGMYIYQTRGYGAKSIHFLKDQFYPPYYKIIKTSSDLLSLSQIANEFNEEQAINLYNRVSEKIEKGNICPQKSGHPFPIKIFNYNNTLRNQDYDVFKWDDWYYSPYRL